MGNGMNKILDGLYVGNMRDAKDYRQLEDNKITHILSIHDNAKKIIPDRTYLCIQAQDSPSEDLTQYFPQCCDFIHEARLGGGRVVVHCLAGVSRSVTICCAYIMIMTDMSWREALNAIRGARRCASPNFGFQRQLQTFEYDKLAQEKKRFKETYRPHDFKDFETLKKLLEIHQRWVLYGEDETTTYPLGHNAYKPQDSASSSMEKK